MPDGVVLAIDQGTTGSRAVVFDGKGAVRGWAYAEFAQAYPKPAWVEHDAAEILRSVRLLIPRALKKARVSAKRVGAVGITNQRETVVLWDRATGKPAAPAIVWQDRRTADVCRAIREQGREPWFRAKTGLTVDPYFSATKVAWLLDNVQGLRKRAEAGKIAMGTMDSWLIWNLTGGRGHATDYSNASRTLLYNIHDLGWDREILDFFHIPESILPEVRSSSGVFGEVAGLSGIEAPITGVAGDQQAALFGQVCFEKGAAKNTYGTGSFVLLNTGAQPATSADLLTTIAWRLGDEPVKYALEGSIFVTGAAVQWLRDGLKIIKSAGETGKLAASLDSNESVYFVPALAGLGAPYWDPFARGAMFGLTRGTTRAHIVRAALESTAYQTRDVIEAMERESGVPLATLRADGGAAANPFLMQFQADMLGVPVEIPKIRETSALGAAYLAGLATGIWTLDGLQNLGAAGR